MNDVIIGHTPILDYFERVIAKDNLSHAYYFVGPDHVGKKTVAQKLSAELLNTTIARLNQSPDFFSLERVCDDKSGKLKKDISIEQVRELITFLRQSPFVRCGYKVALVNEANTMSRGAASAFLKILEEAKEKIIIFLITADEDALLPTIKSRAQKIFFSLVSQIELETFARENNIEEGLAKQMAEHAAGRAGLLISWLHEPTLYGEYQKEIARFHRLIGKPLYQKLQEVEELFSDKTDHIAARDNLIQTLATWQLAWREQLIAGQQFLTKPFSLEQVIAVDACFMRAKIMLAKNVHPRLLVEHILLALP